MSSATLIFDVILSCLITLIFLYRCGNYRRQHPITTGAVFIAWCFSILFVFLLPLDISLVNIQFSFKINFRLLLLRLHILNVLEMKQQQRLLMMIQIK
jgi:hypothetical protein